MTAWTQAKTRDAARIVVLAAMLTLCGSRPVAGQGPACAAKTAAIQSGVMDSVRLWAEESFARCANADHLIGQMWATIPADEFRLYYLQRTTLQLRVRAVYDSLMAVATRPTVPLLVRQYAIAALLPWAAPTTKPALPDELLGVVLHDESARSAAIPFRTAPRASEPSAGVARAQLVPWLRTQFVDAAAQTAVLRKVGIGALQTIANEAPGAITLGAFDLVVTWACGQDFRIINRMRVQLPYVFQIGESADKRELSLPAVDLTRDSTAYRWTFMTYGSLRVFMGKTQVRTVTVPTQSIACP